MNYLAVHIKYSKCAIAGMKLSNDKLFTRSNMSENGGKHVKGAKSILTGK